MKTKEQIRDDFQFLRVGEAASIFALLALGMTEREAWDFLGKKPKGKRNEEARLRLMEGGL